jgi:hypothetical protein
MARYFPAGHRFFGSRFRGESRAGQVLLDLLCIAFVIRLFWRAHLSEKGASGGQKKFNRQTGALPICGRANKPQQFQSKAGWFYETNLQRYCERSPVAGELSVAAGPFKGDVW